MTEIIKGIRSLIDNPTAVLTKSVLLRGYSVIDPDLLSPAETAAIETKMAHQFDQISPNYADSSAVKDDDDYDRHMLINPATRAVIRSTVRPGDTVVDLGAGASPFADTYLGEQSARMLIAVDFSEGLLESGSSRLPVELRDKLVSVVGNMTDGLNFKNVDVATSWLAQLYMLDGQFSRVAANVSSMLKDGGLFVISVPNHKIAESVLGVQGLSAEKSRVVVDLPMKYGKTPMRTTFVVRNIDRYAELASQHGLELESVREMRPDADFFKGGSPVNKVMGRMYMERPPYLFLTFKKQG